MAAVKQNVETFKNKLDKLLHEKNALNDVLEKLETKTGVKRLYIALGNCFCTPSEVGGEKMFLLVVG